MKNLSTTAKVAIGVGGTAATASVASFLIKGEESKKPIRPILKKEGLNLFEKDTNKKLILTSLSQGLGYPFKSFTIPEGTFYSGSQEINVEIKGDNGISLNNPAIDLLHKHCLKILDEPGGFVASARKWCSVIDLREILKRQGSKPLTTNEQADVSFSHKLFLPLTPPLIERNYFYENSDSITSGYYESEGNMVFMYDGEELKNQCFKAFKLKDLGSNQKYLKNAFAFCTELTVKDALIRNGFEPLSGKEDDSVWKEIISGGWFKEGAFFLQNTFLDKKDLFGVSGNYAAPKGGIDTSSNVEEKHISAIKKECSKLLNQPFSRKNFPRFRDSRNQPIADSFQEASWFCVKPRSVRDFVEKTLKKELDVKKESACKSSLDSKTYKFVKGSSDYSDFWSAVSYAVNYVDGSTKCLKD